MRSARPLAAALGCLLTACSNTSSDAVRSPADSGPIRPTDPPADVLPKATGTCPSFAKGTNHVAPTGLARDVEVWVSDAAQSLDGPLVFFWHGAGGSPLEASYALGTAVAEVEKLGGIVVALHHDPAAGDLPWFLSLGGSNDADLRVADEVVACAQQTLGIDVRRIHSVGFSAGAMHNTHFAARRGYLASIVNYSGAHMGGDDVRTPENLYPAMLFHGGAKDQVILQFQSTTEKYAAELQDEGHFAFICNHGLGHTVPSAARGSAWQFLLDHPYGQTPEPYLGGLPTGFPSYCAL